MAQFKDVNKPLLLLIVILVLLSVNILTRVYFPLNILIIIYAGLVVYFIALIVSIVRTRKNVLPKVILFLIIFVLTFVILELAFKYAVYEGTSDFSLFIRTDDLIKGWEYASGFSFFGNIEALSEEHSEEYFKILVLGDSVLHESESQGPTAPRYIYELLKENKSNNYFIYNAAVTGYSSLQQLQLFEQETKYFKPDMIMIGYVFNDPFPFLIINNLLEKKEILKREGMINEQLDLPFECKLRTTLAKSWQVSESGLLDVIREQYLFVKGRNILSLDDDPEFFRNMHGDPCYWPRIQRFFEELGLYSKENNIPAIIVIFPVNFNAPNTGVSFEWDKDYPLNDIHKKLESEARRNNLIVIQALDFLKNYDPDTVRLDPGDTFHYNKETHKLIGRFLYEEIDEEGLFSKNNNSNLIKNAK